MKIKNLFYVLFLMLFITSCSSNDDNSVRSLSGELYPVEFTVMATDVVDFPSPNRIGQISDPSVIKSYYLYIYNSLGNLMEDKKIEKENISETTPQVVKMNLPAGTYKAVILAFNDDNGALDYSLNKLSTAYAYTIHDKFITPVETSGQFPFVNVYYNDYFYKKTTFVVSASTSPSAPIEVDLKATRITGRLSLKYNDISTGDTNLDYGLVIVDIENFPYGVKFNTDTYKEAGYSEPYYLTKAQWKVFATRTMVINCMPTSTPKITLKFCKLYNPTEITDRDFTQPNVIYERTIDGFQVYENKITKLTGNIFDNSQFEISIDTAWDDDVTGEF